MYPLSHMRLQVVVPRGFVPVVSDGLRNEVLGCIQLVMCKITSFLHVLQEVGENGMVHGNGWARQLEGAAVIHCVDA